MRLNPALEETGRHRQADRSVLDRLQVHAGKPARIDVVADFGAQAPLHPNPALLIHVRHFIVSRRLKFQRTQLLGLTAKAADAPKTDATFTRERHWEIFEPQGANAERHQSMQERCCAFSPWAEVSRKKLDQDGEWRCENSHKATVQRNPCNLSRFLPQAS